MLAYMPQGERDEILQQIEPRRLTPNTIASRQELEQHLHRVRKVGHAFDLEEHEPHIRCVAAPIWDHYRRGQCELELDGPRRANGGAAPAATRASNPGGGITNLAGPGISRF